MVPTAVLINLLPHSYFVTRTAQILPTNYSSESVFTAPTSSPYICFFAPFDLQLFNSSPALFSKLNRQDSVPLNSEKPQRESIRASVCTQNTTD